MGILFYILGIITGTSIVGLFIYRSKFFNLEVSRQSLLKSNSELLKYKSDKESRKRRCKYKTSGWYKVSEANNPNKKTWDVVYELKEVEYSEDEKKTRFEVINVFSDGKFSGDEWTPKDYIDWLINKTGGGWLDNLDRLEWITNSTKSEILDDKLDQLLND